MATSNEADPSSVESDGLKPVQATAARPGVVRRVLTSEIVTEVPASHHEVAVQLSASRETQRKSRAAAMGEPLSPSDAPSQLTAAEPSEATSNVEASARSPERSIHRRSQRRASLQEGTSPLGSQSQLSSRHELSVDLHDHYGSDYDQLKKHDDALKRLRLRVSGSLIAFGGVSWPLGLWLGFLRLYGFLGPAWGADGFYFAFGLPGVYLMLLGIMPTDRRLCRYVPLLLCAYMLAGITMVGGVVVLSFLKIDLDAPPVRKCSPDLNVGCVAFACGWMGVQSAAALIAVNSFRAFRRAEKQPRLALRLTWKWLRVGYALFGVSTTVYLVVRSAAEASFFLSLTFWGTAAHAFTDIFWAALWTPRRRRRFLGWLRNLSMGSDDTVAAAALVASLVSKSGGGPKKAILHAKKGFRGLSFDQLHLSDLQSNADTGMYPRTHRYELGSVDVFVSHSWRDSPKHKYRALEAFAADFQQKHGRAPTIWLDKACINQQRIEESLSCLPLYLNGCKTLLVLCGPTYVTRLWCVMELFVAFQGRAAAAGGWLQVVPIPSDDQPALSRAQVHRAYRDANRAFDAFSCEDANCYDPDDKEHLLSVIQTGFGSFENFNQSVADSFDDELLPIANKLAWEEAKAKVFSLLNMIGDRDARASALQSTVRGRQARAELGEQQKAATSVQKQVRGRFARKAQREQLDAVVKVQALQRGRLARRVTSGKHELRRLGSALTKESLTEESLLEQKESEAALKVQSILTD